MVKTAIIETQNLWKLISRKVWAEENYDFVDYVQSWKHFFSPKLKFKDYKIGKIAPFGKLD